MTPVLPRRINLSGVNSNDAAESERGYVHMGGGGGLLGITLGDSEEGGKLRADAHVALTRAATSSASSAASSAAQIAVTHTPSTTCCATNLRKLNREIHKSRKAPQKQKNGKQKQEE